MSDEEERQEKRGFKVEDRRRFSETGEVRPGQALGQALGQAPGQADATERPAAPEEETPPTASAPASAPEQRETGGPPLTFSAFIFSLSTQALAHLGEIPDPIDNRITIDLPAAKQMIDILGILQEKSKGNLDNSESGLLESVLYDLRLKYVERVRRRS
jgi:hypothetical protein